LISRSKWKGKENKYRRSRIIITIIM